MPKIPTKAYIAFYIVSIFLVCVALTTSPKYFGDGTDYIYTLQAWFDHRSPDIRTQDITSANAILAHNHIHMTLPVGTIVRARYGREFTMHFWMYSLLALPAKYILHWFNGNELSALVLTNTLLLIAAVFTGLFSKPYQEMRLYLVGLATIGPALGYLIWTSSEIFSWAFVLMAIIYLENRKYSAASLCAGIASTQNSPIIFLVLYCILVSLRERNAKLTLKTLGGFIIACIPVLFYYQYYGYPSLIAATGITSIHLVSFTRTLSLFTDLNQGMFVYVPLLVILLPIATLIFIRTRNWSKVGVAATLICMVLSVETTTNWNSGAAGVMRYAVWMAPLLAWIALSVLPITQVWRRVLLLAVLVQVDLTAPHLQGADDHLSMSPLACWTLSMAPALYDPETEIFLERQIHKEPAPTDTYRSLPVGFITPSGVVTKILVTPETLSLLRVRYSMDRKTEKNIVQTNVGKSGLFYINPPFGAVRANYKGQSY